eukprot:Skav202914  [mRNA]  locus=scaffold1565:83554:84517:+ [translate_table: standard]
MSHITTCLPNLQELDLLSFGPLVKWPEDESTRKHFAQSFAKLSTLKLALAEYQQADMLASLSELRVLHLGLPYCHRTFGMGSPRMLFTHLAKLGALEFLRFVGHRSAISKRDQDGHLIFAEVTNDIKQLLMGCSLLQTLAIVPCVGLSEEIFRVLSAHGKSLQTLALYVSSAMTLQSLPLLNACPLLRQVRLAREGGLEENGFVVPGLQNIQVSLDPLVDPNFFHSETLLA